MLADATHRGRTSHVGTLMLLTALIASGIALVGAAPAAAILALAALAAVSIVAVCRAATGARRPPGWNERVQLAIGSLAFVIVIQIAIYATFDAGHRLMRRLTVSLARSASATTNGPRRPSNAPHGR